MVGAGYAWNAFDSRDDLVSALGQGVIRALNAALAERETAVFAVSGGSTPRPLFELLSNTPLPWERVHIALVDERWVDPGQPGSNEDFIVSTLVRNHAANAHFVGMKTQDASPLEAVRRVNDAYARLPGPFDAVLLGLGADGHTASWFPHAQGLDVALDPQGRSHVAAIRAHPSDITGPHLDRLTVTFPAVVAARTVVMMITGDEKRAALEAAAGPGELADMPVRALLRHDMAPLDVYWAA